MPAADQDVPVVSAQITENKNVVLGGVWATEGPTADLEFAAVSARPPTRLSRTQQTEY